MPQCFQFEVCNSQCMAPLGALLIACVTMSKCFHQRNNTQHGYLHQYTATIRFITQTRSSVKNWWRILGKSKYRTAYVRMVPPLWN